MEDLALPELTSKQTEQLCSIAEAAARRLVLSKVPSKEIEKLDISVEAEGSKPVKLTVDVDILLTSRAQGFHVQAIADQAVKEALASGEEYLRELACHSKE